MRPAFLDVFNRVTPAGDGKWRTECAHCGSDRGLSFGEGRDRYLLKPFCGCNPREVLATVNLNFEDLLFETTTRGSSVFKPLRGVSTSTGGIVDSVDSVNPSIHAAHAEGELEQLLTLFEQGKIDELPKVEVPAVPDDATDPMRRVAAFYEHVAALRAWAGMPPDVMFASTWVGAKLGIPQPTAWRAITALENAGVLKCAGSRPGRSGRRGPKLYVTGEGIASNVVRLENRRAA